MSKIRIHVLLLFLYEKTSRFKIVHDYLSTFHKIKSRTYINIPRHSSLQMNVLIRHVEFKNCITIIEGDVLVKKIKVKKTIFKFPTASINNPFIKFYMINTSK